MRTIALALFAALAASALSLGPARAAADSRPVQTETIVVPPDKAIEPGMPEVPPDSSEPTVQPDQPAVQQPDMPIPEVLYDLAKLPTPVVRLRQQIIDAAATGDPEKLRPIIEAFDPPPQLAVDDTGDDPITFLKKSSGDPGGREILAILTEVLEAGFVHINAGSPDEMYVWPYFAYYPVDKLTPPQLVELFKLVYSGDYEDMLAYGAYQYYRVGIAPDGTWKFFLTGD